MAKQTRDEDTSATPEPTQKSSLTRLGKALGPGLVTGAADDDPSGIATYAQAGAMFKNAALWTVPATLPMMMAVQEICDRTALTTGESLGKLARRKFTRGIRTIIAILIAALLIANGVNLAADLMAIGEGMEMLGAGPGPVWSVLSGATITALLMKGSFNSIAKVFKWLCLVLFTYVGVLIFTHIDWSDVLKGLTFQQTQFRLSYWAIIVAVLGTTVSPYLFFWQSAHRVEELRDEKLDGGEAPSYAERSRDGAERKQTDARIDVFTGMAFSVLIMFAIMVATASTLGTQGLEVNSAADAAKALEPIAGPLAKVLFALGFIGSGLLAVPVLAASGAIGMAGLLNKNWGLERSPKKAPVFYLLLAAGTIAGTLLSAILSDPIALLVLSATINGIAAAPFLVVVMLISGDPAIMGTHRNGLLAGITGWATAGIMAVAGVIGIWATIVGS
ncbi:iron transporter [Arthrobacter psychrolactophilus]|uniref:Iron transporter n=1 Tax=Arthrobacter psychrolactophilus TaxID=92442 RepID=A0A2V5ISZ3_9MICC|nr:divalent metal cation transporter [Arthrobacter psychrolactophilus]PYI37263.1 iron transporter [Arthrobacter psychrolactophilus]